MFRGAAAVAVELAVGLPDAQRGEFGLVGLEFVEHLPDELERDFAPSPGLGEEDGEGFDLVAIGGQPVGEFVGQGFGLRCAVLVPAGVGDRIQIVVVDGLFFFTADGVDEFDQFAVEQGGGGADQLVLGLVAQGVAGVVAEG